MFLPRSSFGEHEEIDRLLRMIVKIDSVASLQKHPVRNRLENSSISLFAYAGGRFQPSSVRLCPG